MILLILPHQLYNVKYLRKYINMDDNIVLWEHPNYFTSYNFNKLTIVPFQERKYCNGGWNLGVSLVKTYYYALCNDDILFPTSVIDDVFHFYKLRPKSGFIGMHKTQFDTACKPDGVISKNLLNEPAVKPVGATYAVVSDAYSNPPASTLGKNE